MQRWILGVVLTAVVVLLSIWLRREPETKLKLVRIPEVPALTALLPDPCPLTAIEYRYETFMTRLLVERFDQQSLERKTVFGRRRIQVNTDGAPNSYHSRAIKADDPNVGAINIICNAEVKIFKTAGNARTEVPCRQGSFSVTDEYVTAYEALRLNNWADTPAGHSIQFDWGILARGERTTPGGPFAPCVTATGFFVAKTKLQLGEPSGACDGSVYPDSSLTSAFVLPKNWFSGYRKTNDAYPEPFSNFKVGDVVVAYRPGSTNRPPIWVYGVIGDAGPFRKLGEATIAFNRQLLRSTAPIKTYRAALDLDTDVLTPKEIAFVAFEGSAAELGRDYSPANIRRVGESRFTAWTNGTLELAQSRFLACAKKLELIPVPST